MLGVRLVFALALGTLLAGCGFGDQGSGNAPDAARSAGEASDAGASSNVAEAAAAGIDEPSIQANLAYLTGASPPRSPTARPRSPTAGARTEGGLPPGT
jgi:hypothetical protein